MPEKKKNARLQGMKKSNQFIKKFYLHSWFFHVTF